MEIIITNELILIIINNKYEIYYKNKQFNFNLKRASINQQQEQHIYSILKRDLCMLESNSNLTKIKKLFHNLNIQSF